MRDFKGMKRQRGRNRKPGGGGQGNSTNPNRSWDSAGPEGIKVRGNAQTVYERYQQLARDAFSSGDRVLAENYLQHGEHYFRVLRALQPQRSVQDIAARETFNQGFDIDFEDESGAQAAAFAAAEAAQQQQQQRQSEGGDDRDRQDRDRQDRDRHDRDRGDRDRGDRDRSDRDRSDRDRDRQDRDRPRADRPERDDRESRGEGDDRPRGSRRDRYERRPRYEREGGDAAPGAATSGVSRLLMTADMRFDPPRRGCAPRGISSLKQAAGC